MTHAVTEALQERYERLQRHDPAATILQEDPIGPDFFREPVNAALVAKAS